MKAISDIFMTAEKAIFSHFSLLCRYSALQIDLVKYSCNLMCCQRTRGFFFNLMVGLDICLCFSVFILTLLWADRSSKTPYQIPFLFHGAESFLRSELVCS